MSDDKDSPGLFGQQPREDATERSRIFSEILEGINRHMNRSSSRSLRNRFKDGAGQDQAGDVTVTTDAAAADNNETGQTTAGAQQTNNAPIDESFEVISEHTSEDQIVSENSSYYGDEDEDDMSRISGSLAAQMHCVPQEHNYEEILEGIAQKNESLRQYAPASKNGLGMLPHRMDWAAGNPADPDVIAKRIAAGLKAEPIKEETEEDKKTRERIAEVMRKHNFDTPPHVEANMQYSVEGQYGFWATGERGEKDIFIEVTLKRISGSDHALLAKCGVNRTAVFLAAFENDTKSDDGASSTYQTSFTDQERADALNLTFPDNMPGLPTTTAGPSSTVAGPSSTTAAPPIVPARTVLGSSEGSSYDATDVSDPEEDTDQAAEASGSDRKGKGKLRIKNPFKRAERQGSSATSQAGSFASSTAGSPLASPAGTAHAGLAQREQAKADLLADVSGKLPPAEHPFAGRSSDHQDEPKQQQQGQDAGRRAAHLPAGGLRVPANKTTLRRTGRGGHPAALTPEQDARADESYVYLVKVVALARRARDDVVSNFRGPRIGRRFHSLLGSGAWVAPPLGERLERRESASGVAALYAPHMLRPAGRFERRAPWTQRLGASVPDWSDRNAPATRFGDAVPVWMHAGEPCREDVLWMAYRLACGVTYRGLRRGVGFGRARRHDAHPVDEARLARCPFVSPSEAALVESANWTADS